jgi:hypothetical protein
MDIYFEKIAGVAEPREISMNRQQPPEPRAVPDRPASQPALDDDGFPLSPMDDQDNLWFVQAARMHRPLARAAGLARSSGSMMIVSAVLSVIVGGLALASGDMQSGSITLGASLLLFILGLVERSAGSDLAALNPHAPRRLALNQLVLFLVVVGCCFVGIQDADMAMAAAGSADTNGLPPGMANQVGEQVEVLAPMLIYGIYGLMIAISLVIQGGMALYYLSRKKAVLVFHNELPPWVADVVATLNRR